MEAQGIAVIWLGVVRARRRGCAVIDAEDLDRVWAHRWTLLENGYARGTVDGRATLLHRFVTGAPPGSVVCHLNGDPLDCRKKNLLVATRRVNSNQRHATEGRPGIGTRRGGRYWRAGHGEDCYLGVFRTREEALLVRDFAVRCRVGMVATYNYPAAAELGYWPGEWRNPPEEGALEHPAAVVALRTRDSAMVWGARKCVLHAWLPGAAVMYYAGSEWGPWLAGRGVVTTAEGCWTVTGGALARQCRGSHEAVWRAVGALLDGAVWYASWLADGAVVHKQIWGPEAAGTCPGVEGRRADVIEGLRD